MRRARALPLLLAVLALALPGCGVGSGSESGSASVMVTRDFGATEIGSEGVSGIPAGETVMRLLQRSFDVETRYGGNFVQSIEGLAGGQRGSRSVDWFFYVNGIEASEGAGTRRVADGDRIWWDHHDWSAVMRVPAVVGAFPEPFLSGVGGKRLPVRLDCAPSTRDACDEVRRRLIAADVPAVSTAAPGTGAGEQTLRLLVGPWAEIRRDRAALQLEQGPAASGVFARPIDRGRRIELYDQRGEVVRTLDEAAGLVAATRFAEQQPTWVVTGTDAAGVAAAAAALEEGILTARFAVAVEDGRSLPLPVRPERL